MLVRKREVSGSADQGEAEKLAYAFDWVQYGTPISPTVIIELESDGTDKSATMLVGIPAISGTNVITPLVKDPVRGVKYRLRCATSIVGDPTANVYEAFVYILGQR